MRHTEFWARMEAALGEAYATSWARSHVMGALGERTAVEALAAGYTPKEVWRVVWETLGLPPSQR
jgi:hypothetical protein